jgi:hypothetical protein
MLGGSAGLDPGPAGRGRPGIRRPPTDPQGSEPVQGQVPDPAEPRPDLPSMQPIFTETPIPDPMERALDLLAAPRPFQDLPPCPPAPNRPTGHPYRLRPPGEPTPTPPDHPAKPEVGPAILRLQISPRSALSSSQSSRISSRPWPLGTSRTSGGRSHPPWPRRPSRTAASTSGGFPWIGPRSPPFLDPLSHLQPSANRSTPPATKTKRNGKAKSETFPGRGSGGEETAGAGSADRNAPGPTAPCPAAKLDRSGRLRGARSAQTGGEIGGRAGLGGPGSRPAHPASSTAWSYLFKAFHPTIA